MFWLLEEKSKHEGNLHLRFLGFLCPKTAISWPFSCLSKMVISRFIETLFYSDSWEASLLLFLWFFLCLFLLLFVCFLRVKGQLRYPERPPHLALNPPQFLFVWGGSFLFSFLKAEQGKICLSSKRTVLLVSQCLPLFLPIFFRSPFTLSLSLSYIYIQGVALD